MKESYSLRKHQTPVISSWCLLLTQHDKQLKITVEILPKLHILDNIHSLTRVTLKNCNPGKNIWNKTEKLGKTRQGDKSLISISAIAKV